MPGVQGHYRALVPPNRHLSTRTRHVTYRVARDDRFLSSVTAGKEERNSSQVLEGLDLGGTREEVSLTVSDAESLGCGCRFFGLDTFENEAGIER